MCTTTNTHNSKAIVIEEKRDGERQRERERQEERTQNELYDHLKCDYHIYHSVIHRYLR